MRFFVPVGSSSSPIRTNHITIIHIYRMMNETYGDSFHIPFREEWGLLFHVVILVRMILSCCNLIFHIAPLSLFETGFYHQAANR